MHLFLYPIADSFWLVAAVAAALLLLVILIGPGRERVPLRRRATLGLLRGSVILLLVLGMLRPTLVYTEIRKQKATLVLLVDQSRSMSVRDGLNGKARWDALKEALDDAVPGLRALGRDFEVKAYSFDAETHSIDVKDGKLALPETPLGQQTAIGAALDDVLSQENGKRLLGIVILTDGRQQATAPRDTSPQNVADKLRHLGYPAFPVVLGQSRGLGGVQDLAVKDMQANEQVFVKNELTISGQIKVDGYVARKIPVRVLMETAPGKMEVVAQQDIAATTDGQLLPVAFSHTPETPGEYKITLEAVPQPGEIVTTNNRLSTFVQVLKGGLNVLYIEGSPRVEQKFLRRSLDASRDIRVDSIRIDAQHPETRPPDFIEKLKPGKYDVYILGDVDSTAFNGSELKQLAETVNRGAGLIMLGGFHTFGPGGYFNTPLDEVLPVMMDRLDRQNIRDPVRPDVHLPGPLRMQPTPIGLQHFALMLAALPQENAAAWAKLPPLEGANYFRKLTSGAVALAGVNGEEEKPLLVTQTYGNGRVLAFAGDSTWRWSMHGFETPHKRFWRQIVLWLAKKDQLAQGSVWVRLENRRFAPGNRVEFTAGAQSQHNEPITDAEFKVEIIKPNNARTPGVLIRQEEHMSGSFRETQLSGDYTIEVSATQKGQLLGAARTRFIVMEQDLELDNASADPDTMESVAKASGGRTIAPEQLSDLIGELTRKTAYLDVKQETKKSLWDQWPFFFVMVGLMTIEWFLRKRWGLV